MRDRYFIVKERDSGGGVLGFALVIAFIIALLIIALPLGILWYVVFTKHFLGKYYNAIANSLSSVKKWSIMAWAVLVYIAAFMSQQSTTIWEVEIQPFLPIGTFVIMALVGLDYFYLKNKGLNPWSGTEKVRSKSVAKALGLAELLFLGVFAISGLVMQVIAVPLIISVVVGLVSYFIIENFL
ncbi:hypothetical protein OL233_05170 [Vagococcus sp. PNs007]|uniref:DUF624 domain-containing protein n=1 Tax=Vagococcus proximus TaxID=2991417 RepID=A0ABT5X193_9ENTE|nr:hypothetical protein [Vagococcus proximus]MDF0479674.1 hypothetical protein [Vagococcus proximus]